MFPSPKKFITKFIIKYARKTITNPTKAATIIFLAASTPALSPPEVIHLMPPNIRKASATRTATTNISVITAFIIPPTLPTPKLQSTVKLLVQGATRTSPVAAKAGIDRLKYVKIGRLRADSFFITNKIV